jgi:hypothetical protein
VSRRDQVDPKRRGRRQVKTEKDDRENESRVPKMTWEDGKGPKMQTTACYASGRCGVLEKFGNLT